MKKSSFANCFSQDALLLSWERVLASVGADAKDYFGISLYNHDLEENLKKLSHSLCQEGYNPKRPFKYFEPKKNGTQRTKTVLGIDDALVYQAICNHIAELTYSSLLETSQSVFGSVLNKDVLKGVSLLKDEPESYYFFEFYVEPYNRFIDSINETIELGNVTHILETDITGFFDTIPHSTLISLLKSKDIDSDILELLSKCLNYWSGTRDSATIGVGIPQGPAGSFLLANIVLDSMDRLAIKDGLHYFRFMDDIRIYGKSRNELNNCLAKIDRHLKGKSLCLNTDKTSIELIAEHQSDKEEFLDDYGISIENDGKSTEDQEILERAIFDQDSTQEVVEQSKEENLSKAEFIPLYRMALKGIEKKLKAYYRKNHKKSSKDLNTSDMRELLTLSQKWRTIVKVLKEEEAYEPNKQLVQIWEFGISSFFWKTNNFVWNLRLYDDLSDHYESIFELFNEFEIFEWVQYQILSSFNTMLGEGMERHQIFLQLIPKTESPLVRLGYFSILIETINKDTKFFQSVAELIKDEKDSYVKNSILHSIKKKHLNIPLDTLKSWFL